MAEFSSFSPAVNAVVRTLGKGDLSEAEITTCRHAIEFRQRILQENAQIIAESIEGIPEKEKLKFIEAYLFRNIPKGSVTSNMIEHGMFAEFQGIDFLRAQSLVWSPSLKGILVDNTCIRIPQSHSVIESILQLRCARLNESEIEIIRHHTKTQYGPWQFHDLVYDFVKEQGQLLAVDEEGAEVALIVPQITPLDFMNKYAEVVAALPLTAQRTIAYHLSSEDSPLAWLQGALDIKPFENAPGVVLVIEQGPLKNSNMVFTRPQTTEQFLSVFPASNFEFGVEDAHIHTEVINFIREYDGEWNQVDLVKRFFKGELGGVCYELASGTRKHLPLVVPFSELMSVYVDDNPDLSIAAKRLFERIVEREGWRFLRGNIQSISGSENTGVFVRNMDGKVSHAVFATWENPVEEIQSDPLISSASKQAILQALQENPHAPEWQSRGYITSITETGTEVIMTFYNGEKRFIHRE